MSQTNFEDDEILGKAYDGRLMRRLLVFVRPYWRRLAVAMLLLFGAAFAELALPLLKGRYPDGRRAALVPRPAHTPRAAPGTAGAAHRRIRP